MLAYPHLLDSQMSAAPHSPNVPYDPRGRQKNFVESAMQRKERIEFLKQREWVRRVTEWLRETNAQNYSVRVPFHCVVSPVDVSCSAANF